MTSQLTQHRYSVLLADGGHTLARRLIINVFVQACLDAKSRNYYTAQQALAWLNTPSVRELADWIELDMPAQDITPATVARLYRFRATRGIEEAQP